MNADGSAGLAQIEAATRLASAFVLGIDNCLNEGRALTQRQTIDLLQAALVEFDGARAALEGSFQVSELFEREAQRRAKT